MVGLVVDLSFVEKEARVGNLDFFEKVVVVEMVMKLVGFDLEFVDFVDFGKMEDIEQIEQISHKDFAYYVLMIDMVFEIGAKVVAKNSNLVGAKSS